MASLKELLFGRKPKMKQLPTMDPQQQQLLSQLLGGLGAPAGAGLQGLMQLLSGEPGAFEAFEAPAMRQFEEQIVPGIAERFSGAGGGAQQSSAFQQALSQAGAGLSERLAAQRGELQTGARSQLMQLLGLGLQQRPFGYGQQAGTPGFLGGITPGIGAGLGGILESRLGRRPQRPLGGTS